MSFSNIVINRITQVNYLFKPFCRQWILINGATNLQTAKGPTDIGLHFGKEKKKGLGQMERLEGFGRIQSLAAPFDSPFGFAQTCANQLQENLSKFRK